MTKDLASRKHKELYKKKSEKMGQDTCIDTWLTEKEMQMAKKNLKINILRYFALTLEWSFV